MGRCGFLIRGGAYSMQSLSPCKPLPGILFDSAYGL
jgi:hypothetical protein